MTKKSKVVNVKGTLDNWSLLREMNTGHPDFGAVAAFINSQKWKVEITLPKRSK